MCRIRTVSAVSATQGFGFNGDVTANMTTTIKATTIIAHLAVGIVGFGIINGTKPAPPFVYKVEFFVVAYVAYCAGMTAVWQFESDYRKN